MKIRYEFLTDEVSEVEVDEQFGKVIKQLEKDEYNSNRRETRRHLSYSDCNDKQEALLDPYMDVEAIVDKNILKEVVSEALQSLQPQQQELIKQVFYMNRPMAEVAKELGITKQACNNRFNRIYAQIKKYF